MAVTRKGNTFTLYLDGRIVASAQMALDMQSTAAIVIGNEHQVARNTPFKGYIDEFRVTLGLARYPEDGESNFAPPRAPFEADAYTMILAHADKRDSTLYRPRRRRGGGGGGSPVSFFF